jgi:peptidoglycan/LPS O-acetylase OafA/YrhL
VSSAERGRPTRLVELESLRGVAATSILVFHCWLFSSAAVLTWNLGPFSAFMQPLQSGVTLFFVLSGFLLYGPMASAMLAGEPRVVSFRRYLRNRALRIVPAYVFVLLVTTVLLESAIVRVTRDGVEVGALDGRRLAADLFLVQTYHPASIWSGILPAWSLTIEVAFYVLLPVLAYVASRLVAPHRRVAAAVTPVAVMLVVGALGKIVATAAWGNGRVGDSSWHAVFDRSLLTHADLFGFGMAAGLAYALWSRRESAPRSLGSATVGRLLAYLGIPTLFIGFYFLPSYLYDGLVALFAAVLILRVTVGNGQKRRGGLLRHPWSMACGRVSYGIFLWNFPVLTFLGQHGLLADDRDALAFLQNLALTAMCVGILSVLTYRLIELPALKWKRERAPVRVPIPTT